MTILQYLAQQHRFAKWQIRKLNALPSTDQNDDDLYFFARLSDYLQDQRAHYQALKAARPHPYPYISEPGVDDLFKSETFDNAGDFLDSLND